MAMDSKSGGKKPLASSSLFMGPGFRFHPTDEELVRYYLRRKVCGKAFRFDAILEIDVYKTEPWDLPSMSKLKTRDLEWYFFSVLDKKYGNGARTNRATEKGYWKTTGKDRAVYHKTQVVGMKKTLVYHSGRAPKGQRTNWVMHEYRLVDIELETAGIAQDAFVLCRVFQKSGSGPKNGEQYGAPFVEEEWDDDEFELVPENEAKEELETYDDACLDYHDLQQILGSDIPSTSAPISANFHSADSNIVEETTESFDNMQTHLSAGHQYGKPATCADMNINSLPSYNMDVKPVNDDIGECSKSGNLDDMGFLLDEPFVDSSDNLQYADGGFIEANDLSKPIETDSTTFDMLEEYLAFCDANDDNSLYFMCDPTMMPRTENLLSLQTSPQKEPGEGTEQAVLPSGTHIDGSDNINPNAAVSSDKQELAKYQSNFELPFIQKASQMLGSTAAPPAFAAEFPSKEAVHRLQSALQASSSSHVTSGMVQIRNLNMGSTSKHDNFDILLCFGFSRGDDVLPGPDSNVGVLSGKMVYAISRDWFYFIFFWVLILYMSFKIGAYIHAH